VGPCLKHSFSAGAALDERGSSPPNDRLRRCPTRCTDPVWTKQRGQGGRPTATHHHGYRQRTPQAAHGHCVRAAPAMTWLPLNVAIIDNDRGDSPSSYRAHALRAGAPELPSGTPWMDACKVAAIGRDVLLSQSARGGMTRC